MPVPILRSFADTPEGQIHYAMAGKENRFCSCIKPPVHGTNTVMFFPF